MKEKKLENDLIRKLHHCAPNPIQIKVLKNELNADAQELEKVADSLEKKGILEWIGKREGLRLKNCDNIPINTTIQIGATEIPRLMAGDSVYVEAINNAIERLAEYANSLENKFKDEVEKRMRSYWGNIITLFGIFISLFAFILSVTNNAVFDAEWGFWTIFLNNLAIIGPLLCVMAVFLILLKILFK
jgi:hypothetical protein